MLVAVTSTHYFNKKTVEFMDFLSFIFLFFMNTYFIVSILLFVNVFSRIWFSKFFSETSDTYVQSWGFLLAISDFLHFPFLLCLVQRLFMPIEEKMTYFFLKSMKSCSWREGVGITFLQHQGEGIHSATEFHRCTMLPAWFFICDFTECNRN